MKIVAIYEIAGEIFFDEEEVGRILKKEISSLRSDAARRRGPPRIADGNCILYRAVPFRDWLMAREINYDELRSRVRDGEVRERSEANDQ